MTGIPDLAPTWSGGSSARYFVLTPANGVTDNLPSWTRTRGRPLVTPRLSPAGFAEYLLDLAEDGGTEGALAPAREHFLYCLEGSLDLRVHDGTVTLGANAYAYVPPGEGLNLQANGPTRTLWITRHYEPVDDSAGPEFLHGSLDLSALIPDEIPGLSYTLLLPDDCRYDFAMNVMRFEPGATLGMVEIHHHEHGLYMLEGGGFYFLDRDVTAVQAADFIYMAPYCPQFYASVGLDPSMYLLYKDVNRDGFLS